MAFPSKAVSSDILSVRGEPEVLLDYVMEIYEYEEKPFSRFCELIALKRLPFGI